MKDGDKMAKKVEVTKTVKETAPVKAAEVKVEAVKAEPVKAAEVKAEAVKAEPAKKAGRKPKAEKAATVAPKKAPAKKATVKKTSVEKTCNFYIQFAGEQFEYESIIERSKEAAAADMGKRVSSVKTIDIYCKPEERAAYYVANGKIAGRIDL